MDIFEDQIIVREPNHEPIILASFLSSTLYPVEFQSTDTILVLTNEYF